MLGKAYNNALGSSNHHPRYHVRAVAIASAAIGMVLTFITLMAALRGRWQMGPARVLTGVAMIPVCILTVVPPVIRHACSSN